MIGFKEDYTVEEALRFYANREFYTVIDGNTHIVENGAVASAGLKSLSDDYCERKGDVALFEAKEKNNKLISEFDNHKQLFEFVTANCDRVIAERNQLEYQLDRTAFTVKVLQEQLAANQAHNVRLREVMQEAADQIRKCDYTPARSALLTALRDQPDDIPVLQELERSMSAIASVKGGEK